MLFVLQDKLIDRLKRDLILSTFVSYSVSNICLI